MTLAFQKTPFNQNVTILDDTKYGLTGEPIEGNQPGRYPRMHLTVKGNYPHIRVYLNNGKKKEEGQIDLALDLKAAAMVIEALKEAIKATQPMCNFIAVKRQGFDRNTNKPTEPYVAAVIAVGKNADGCEFIGIQRGQNQQSKNYMKLTFLFTEPEFHPLLNPQTGQEIPRSQVSSLVAKAMVSIWTQLLFPINAVNWDYNTTPAGKWAVKQAADNPQQGYRGNDYSNRGNSQSNNSYNNNQASNAGNNYSSTPASAAPANSSADDSSDNDGGFGDDLPW